MHVILKLLIKYVETFKFQNDMSVKTDWVTVKLIT
jgi:hypothetical protein